MWAFESEPEQVDESGQAARKCDNYTNHGVCNWLVHGRDTESLCEACRLNRVIPDLSVDKNQVRWATMEAAKRRLVYSLGLLELPTRGTSSSGEASSLAFDIKQDTSAEKAMTGHSNGLITVNLSEADPAERERTKEDLSERYRTPLGHFRHESGHYYWDLLVADSDWLDPFRQRFGDERQDYAEALRRHYDEPRQPGPQFVSAYAMAHPWEDWAETWAHYLHIVDSVDTAQDFGLAEGAAYQAHTDREFVQVMDSWSTLSLALNALNRSMGQTDAYPFEMHEAVREKLRFVHSVIARRRSSAKH